MKRIYILWWALAISILGFGSWLKAQTTTNPRFGVAVCAYNSSPPTGTSGTFILVQCDSTGKLKIQ